MALLVRCPKYLFVTIHKIFISRAKHENRFIKTNSIFFLDIVGINIMTIKYFSKDNFATKISPESL